jgi:hypothetical protein
VCVCVSAWCETCDLQLVTALLRGVLTVSAWRRAMRAANDGGEMSIAVGAHHSVCACAGAWPALPDFVLLDAVAMTFLASPTPTTRSVALRLARSVSVEVCVELRALMCAHTHRRVRCMSARSSCVA